MYPASGLGTGYTEDDLPETVSLTYDFAVSLILTKSGSIFGPESVGSYEYRITHDPAGWQIEVQDSGGGWTILDSGIECLITGDGNLTPGDDTVEDQFEASYTVTWSINSESATVSRISLCEWFGGDLDPGSGEGDITILYNTETNKFNADYLGARWEKTGDQSSPVGTYTAIFPATGTVTVS